MDSKSVYGLFNDSFPPVLDGVTITVENYTDWLVGKGKDVCVVTPWNPYDPPHPRFRMHRYFSLPIYNRHPYRYGYPLFDPFIWLKMRRVPFKVVHAHCPFSSGRLARFAANVHDIPLIATFHSKYKTDLDRSLPPFMVDYQMRRMRRFFNNADALWIPQASVEETVRQYGITAPVTVVENGTGLGEDAQIADITPVKIAARQQLGIPDGRLVLLFVGQHIREKGCDIILDALTLLPHDVDWEMHFVGTGYFLGQMQRTVAARGLSPRVTFHGVLNKRDEIRRLYAAADLFLFPSLYDNAPLVVREAAMMGTPAILPARSTAAEVMTDGLNGWLTEPTADAYMHKIVELAHNPAVIREVGKEARKTLCRTWDSVMTEVFEKYNQIIEQHESESANARAAKARDRRRNSND